jgi:hypothetical protein
MKTIPCTLFTWSPLALFGAIVVDLDQVKSQQITLLQLVNTTTNTFISPPLVNGAVIPLAMYPAGSWTIDAVASSGTKSVRFNLDGNPTYRTELSAPWSMTGIVKPSLVVAPSSSPKHQSFVDHSLFFCISRTISGSDR